MANHHIEVSGYSIHHFCALYNPAYTTARLRYLPLLFALFLLPHLPVECQAQDAQTFRSTTDVVLVPVVVHAKQGSVGELKAEQFSVREDGKQQKIASVELIKTGTKVTRRIVPGEYSNEFDAAGPSRITILAIDLINTPFLDQSFVRQQLLRFVTDSLKAGNRVAVLGMYKDGSVKLLHDIDSDPALLAEELKRSATAIPDSTAAPRSESRFDAQRAVTDASNPAVQRAFDEAEALAAFQDQTRGAGAFDRSRSMEATLESMRQIAEAYSGAPGRKSLIWITGSLPFDITSTADLISPRAYFYGSSQDSAQYYATHGGALPPLPEAAPVVSDDVLSPLRQKFRVLLQQFADKNIVVYPIDARGIMTLNGDAADPYVYKLLNQYDRQRSETSQSTMAEIARMTGGKSCVNRNDIANCVKVASDDGEQYYLLSYYRDKKSNKQGWHTLSVKLDVPNTEARARTGYYYGNAALDKDARLRELGAAARSSIPFSTIQFSARFTGASNDGDKRKVKFEFYLPPDSVRAVSDADGKFNLELVVVAGARGGKNYTVSTAVGKDLPATAYSSIQKDGLAFSGVLSVPAGDYTAHFIARDATKNVVGSVIVPLKTEDPGLRAASVSRNTGAPVTGRHTTAVPKLNTSEDFSGAWLPPDVDALRPPVAAGVACPANILEVTSNSAKELVDSVAQFSATEHVVHEDLSLQGTPKTREERDFDYVAAISQDVHGIKVDEYREPKALDNLGGIRSTGLAELAIAFHPFFHEVFDMQCEGLGKWNGQPAWLVYFRELENKPFELLSYLVMGQHYPVLLKGRAWIAADRFQIIHLETDLLHPINEIRLMNEHTEVSYGPVQFKANGVDLWLPKTAELYVRFGKGAFHRSERFDNFKLFSTGVTYKVKLQEMDITSETEVSNQSALPAH